ncbi:hypothetical protein BDV26DRAFT_295596 [Aspergillus bertholletiae]|uniref:Uncharacterized protein n=1 Tax=Aspergillus bertholletiae TaxID=1226010 RepID=A0A5N7AY99_9EURO|nr:hypothetical protein BDV26DRAFT_295596 [Aspergillus bertholletiae]
MGSRRDQDGHRSGYKNSPREKTAQFVKSACPPVAHRIAAPYVLARAYESKRHSRPLESEVHVELEPVEIEISALTISSFHPRLTSRTHRDPTPSSWNSSIYRHSKDEWECIRQKWIRNFATVGTAATGPTKAGFLPRPTASPSGDQERTKIQLQLNPTASRSVAISCIWTWVIQQLRPRLNGPRVRKPSTHGWNLVHSQRTGR